MTCATTFELGGHTIRNLLRMNDGKFRHSGQFAAIENEVVCNGSNNCEHNCDEKYWIDKDAIKSAKERAENSNKISKALIVFGYDSWIALEPSKQIIKGTRLYRTVK